MRRFSLFILGFTVSILIPLFSVFSMETPEELIFAVQDKTGRPFTVRPQREDDTKGLMDLEKAHDALTPKESHFLTRHTTKNQFLFFDYLRTYFQEQVRHIIETSWIVIDSETEEIVGVFNYVSTASTSLIHPRYRGNGVGVAATHAIHAYLATQIGKPNIKLTAKEKLSEDIDAGLETALSGCSYEDFKSHVLSRFFDIEITTYTGFVGDVDHNNIGSLRMCLSTGLTVKGVEDGMIRFVFPPNPETEDKPLRALVERLASKEEDERRAAQEEFLKLYPYTETDFSTEDARTAPTE